MERGPWNPNRCKKVLSRGGWEALVQTLGWAWLPVPHPGSGHQARGLGLSQQGPAGPSPHFNPCLHWARGLHPAHSRSGTKEVPNEACQCLAGLWAHHGHHKSVDHEYLSTGGLGSENKSSLHSGSGMAPSAGLTGLCTLFPLQATLFLSLPPSSAFQHTLPDSLGYGQQSRPQRHMPPPLSGKCTKNCIENILNTRLWSLTDALRLHHRSMSFYLLEVLEFLFKYYSWDFTG